MFLAYQGAPMAKPTMPTNSAALIPSPARFRPAQNANRTRHTRNNVTNPVYLLAVAKPSIRAASHRYERSRNTPPPEEDVWASVGEGAGGVENEGPLDPTAFGGAVLGLAYQPGRYVNPGETQGMGTPTGAVGMAICAALILWAVSGRRRKFESVVLACTALDLVAWFFLSQQSRYITTLAPPSAILLGGAVATLPLGMLAAALAALQAGYSAWLFKNQPLFDLRVEVLRGTVTPEDFQKKTIPFYAASQEINKSVAGGKVALYDEVFGFLLDVPYIWANAGHGTMIPYETMNNADDYVREMKKLGFTDAYISLSPVVKSQEFIPKWLASMGMNTGVAPIDQPEREAQLQNIEQKWQILFADAVASGKLTLVQQFRNGMLFHFQ